MSSYVAHHIERVYGAVRSGLCFDTSLLKTLCLSISRMYRACVWSDSLLATCRQESHKDFMSSYAAHHIERVYGAVRSGLCPDAADS
jgi:hypothetical protein